MSTSFGKKIKIQIFGQSHSDAIGVVIDGLPAGIRIDMDELQAFMDRRAPGGSLATPRKEADKPEFLSGLVDDTTCGAPVAAIIHNTNTRSKDYENLRDIPRPGHSDFTAFVKSGKFHDIRGGGQFSGRLTAPMCIAGGILLQIYSKMGISIKAELTQVGRVQGSYEEMMAEIEKARAEGDSVGAVAKCVITGVPAGLGEPMFDGIENVISQAVFAIPGIKGIEFGSGFAGAALYGSENNDEFYVEDAASGRIATKTNNHGGILGGITSGMPITFAVAFKPTASISKQQNSVSLSRMENAVLEVRGRHDPCIALRGIPCLEAAAALALADFISIE